MDERYTPTPNHEATLEVSQQIDAFRDSHDLTGEMELRAARRVNQAEDMLGRIVETSRGEDVDKVVAKFIDDAMTASELENMREAIAVGLEEVYEHPGYSPHTASELGEAPLADLGNAMRDLGEVKGEAAVETVVEAIEATENVEAEIVGTEGKTEDNLWEMIARSTEHISIYTKDGAHTSRIPLSLPNPHYRGPEATEIHYATGDDLEEVLAHYGVEADVIRDAKEEGWSVSMKALPVELLRTIIAADIYEAASRSSDSELRQQASERNSHVTLADVWNDSTLHHVTDTAHLPTILAEGQLAMRQVDGRVIQTGGVQRGNINFGQEIKALPPDAKNQDRMDNLYYNRHNSSNIYIHFIRPKGCYREGEEYDDGEGITLVPGGLPSTEIGALMLRDPNDTQALEDAWQAVIEAGFYIPIFDADGSIVFTKEDFDEGNIPAAITQKHQWEKRVLEQKEAAGQRQHEQLETEAASHGMTLEEYSKWKQAQPVARPMM